MGIYQGRALRKEQRGRRRGNRLRRVFQMFGVLVLLAALAHVPFALLLALAGLYGVLSHVVSLRSRELAVRVALGATARRIAAMVLRDGLRPVIEGLMIALGTAMVVRKILSVTVAEGLAAIDPLAFLVATTVLVVGGMAACVVPARRASRIDPNVVLKEG
jgi:ABC-type antimicrobial peptide transport system permease subunit